MEPELTPPTLEEVRLAILRQHTQLGQLIDELEINAQRMLDAPAVETEKALNDALEILHTRFMRHLEYEDVHLARWVAPGDVLLGDHEAQRVRARGLVHDRDVFGDPRTVAREALVFVHLLRDDIAGEEERLRALA